MKKYIFILISIYVYNANAQSLDQNFTMSVVPKEEMSISEVNELADISSGSSSTITIDDPKSNENFTASQSILLLDGAHLTPNVHLRISDPTQINESLYRSITYYDGLGRPIQSNAIGQSPNGNDIVQHYDYDQFGRTEKSYLPLPSNQNTGNFIDNPVSQIQTYYQNTYGDTNPFAQQRFDDSPLSRVLESAAPGNDWLLSETNDTDHTTKFDYGTNNVKEIRRYDIDDEGNLVLGIDFYYQNELMKSISKNENWQPTDGNLNIQETFTDKNGRTIATISYVEKNGIVQELVSQYVYDDFGRLVYMIPSKAYEKIIDAIPYQEFTTIIPFENFVQNPTQVIGQGNSNFSLQEYHTENNTITDYDFGGNINFQLDDINPEPGAFLKLGAIFTLPNNGIIVPDRPLFNIYRPGSNNTIWYEFSLINGTIHNVLRANNGPDNDPQAAFRVSILDFDFREILPAEFSLNTTNLNALVFQHEYDIYGRQIAKKTPGRGWEYVVYDQLDNPILVQDANLKNNNQWLFTKHDAFGRVIYSGTYSSTKSREDLQFEVDNFIYNSNDNQANIEKRIPNTVNIGGTPVNYSNNAFPTTGIIELLSVNYYDNYNFTDVDRPTTPSTIENQVVTDKTRGLPTGNWTKTIGENTWSKSYTYYDEKGRSIKVYEKNHIDGYTTTASKLNFRGIVEKAVTEHKRISTSNLLTIIDRYEYDTSDRIKFQYQKINNQLEERIASYEYDELGNTVNKGIGGLLSSNTPLQQTSYTYNIKGWLKGINDVDNIGDNLFAYKLNYNDPVEGTVTGASSLYNGNIAQTIWRSKHDNLKKSYAYAYDDLNRLTDANYLYSDNLIRESTFKLEVHDIDYDPNGNIQYVKRNGQSGAIDILTYDYGSENGNQVVSITDNGAVDKGFIDGNTATDDYEYDANGNMIKDLNKNINSITYNHLDLIEKITFMDGKNISFTYDASGRKLKKTYTDGSNSYQTNYLGVFQYQENQLQFFQMDEGYVYPDNTNTFKHVYTISDHLGNNRVTFSDTDGDGVISSLELLSNTDYYPMGLIQEGEFTSSITSDFNYKFQGKELQEDNDINLYDFGSRMYDPSVGRWFNTDPQNQYGSPYLALGNNSVIMIDPNGEYSEAALITGIIVGAYLGAVAGSIKAQNSGKEWYQGFWKGGVVGAVGGAISGIGGGGFVSNVLWGAAQGGVTGGLNAVLWEENVGEGAARGAATGAVFAAVTSGVEATTNAVDGYGFRTNDGVVDKFTNDFNQARPYSDRRIEIGKNAVKFVQKRYGLSDVDLRYNFAEPDYGYSYAEGNYGDIGPGAFESSDNLKATILHEYGHLKYDRFLDADGVYKFQLPERARWNDFDGVTGYNTSIRGSGKLHIKKSYFKKVWTHKTYPNFTIQDQVILQNTFVRVPTWYAPSSINGVIRNKWFYTLPSRF
ncbi:DUF6443 domain-containing protein [uncultured Aquimarina sp.]|uniref:DUF6443 domain-containing protein n=1 Tax=uncultured Aquimarina sp. TaxID=575652 RepID=UPI002625CAFB|nr:DUF6443 domain-containing protein [uncultured Aquimarina sp.]